MIGAWRNFDELEESLTLEELYILANTQQLREHRIIRKLGAIQGVDIPDIGDEAPAEKQDESFRDRVERRLRDSRGEEEITSSVQGVGYQQV